MHKNNLLSIPLYLRQYFSEDSQFYYYEEYKKHISAHRKIDDSFICLKGFSSSTPIVNSVAFDSNSMGGGFYFRFQGVGVAVDPGIGFVTLMHKNGVFIDDIDIVIVTHAHIDHNCDVAALSSLLYDYNRNKAKDTSLYSEFLGYAVPNGHIIEWYLDETTLENTKVILDSNHVHRLKDFLSCQSIWSDSDKGGNIALDVIHTQHIEGKADTYGLKLIFEKESRKVVWGYTSDTSYFDELADFYNGCQMLLLNISDIYVKDVTESKLKRSHLGFSGTDKLINMVCPKLALISEFCCTNGDYRFEIIRALREKNKHANTLIFPAEIGCKIPIDGDKIECALCRNNADIENVSIIRPRQEFDRLQYVCLDCLL